MKILKRVLFILLSAVFVLLITLSVVYSIDIDSKRKTSQIDNGDAYYSVSLCYKNGSKRNVHKDCETILKEFGITPISVDDVLTAKITASNNGETVLIITTSVDIIDKAEDFISSLSGKYSDLKHVELSDVIIDKSSSFEMQQLWRLENDTERVTAYKRCYSDVYVLSIKLPIDKYAFAKQNGTETDGFPKGKVKPVEEDQIIGETPYI